MNNEHDLYIMPMQSMCVSNQCLTKTITSKEKVCLSVCLSVTKNEDFLSSCQGEVWDVFRVVSKTPLEAHFQDHRISFELKVRFLLFIWFHIKNRCTGLKTSMPYH